MAGDIAVREAPHLLPFSYLALRTNCLLCEALKKLCYLIGIYSVEEDKAFYH